MERFTGRIGLLFLLVLFAGVSASAGAEELCDPGVDNSLVCGSKSLQFEIENNFFLSSFQGSTISAKYHRCKHWAIRFGIGLSADITDSESTAMSSDTLDSERKSDSNSMSVSLNTQYLYYPSPHKEINVFMGAGPLVSFKRTKTTVEGEDNSRSYKSWSLGISGVFGVEWFATKSISLLSEYGGSLSYRRSTNEQHSRGRVAENKASSFNYGPSSVKFGLSVYF